MGKTPKLEFYNIPHVARVISKATYNCAVSLKSVTTIPRDASLGNYSTTALSVDGEPCAPIGM